MTSVTQALVLIVVLFLSFVLHRLVMEPFVDGSDVNDNIANGNPISMSNQPNQRYPDPPTQPRAPVIYQGTPGPLAYEERPTKPVAKSMFYFEQSGCRPECCVYSPYSCGHGCVCWQKPVDVGPSVQQMSSITPRS